MGLIRSMLRAATQLVATQVARNSLFEQPGERESTAPLSPEAETTAGAVGDASAEKEEESA